MNQNYHLKNHQTIQVTKIDARAAELGCSAKPGFILSHNFHCWENSWQCEIQTVSLWALIWGSCGQWRRGGCWLVETLRHGPERRESRLKGKREQLCCEGNDIQYPQRQNSLFVCIQKWEFKEHLVQLNISRRAKRHGIFLLLFKITIVIITAFLKSCLFLLQWWALKSVIGINSR